MALMKRGERLVPPKMINGQRVSRVDRVRRQEVGRTTRQRRSSSTSAPACTGGRARSRASLNGGPMYKKTYTPLKSARNRDAQIVAHFLPHFGAKPLDEITKSDIVRYLNLRRTQMTGNPGAQEPPPRVGEHGPPRARTAAVDLRARDRRGLRHPQPVPRHQAREGQAADARADARRGDDAAGCAPPALPAVRPLRARHRLPPRRDPRHRCRSSDIDWMRGTVHVIGKFRKERDVPMQPDAQRRARRNSSKRKANCGSRIRSGYVKCWPKARRARRFRRSLRTRCATRSAPDGSRRAATSTSCRRSSGTRASPSPRRTTRIC